MNPHVDPAATQGADGGNQPWIAEEIEARERLVALVESEPGLAPETYWRKLADRPANWQVWDVTTILLDQALGGRGWAPRLKVRTAAGQPKPYRYRFYAQHSSVEGVTAPKRTPAIIESSTVTKSASGASSGPAEAVAA